MDFNKIAKPYLDMFPDIFTKLEAERLRKISNGDKWNKSCYLPSHDIAVVMANNSRDFNKFVLDPVFENYVCDVSCLAAWRFGGKHVIEFDESSENALVSSGISGEIPMEVLMKIPFLGVYIKTRENNYGTNGFFVSTSESQDGRVEMTIAFVLDAADKQIQAWSLDMNSNKRISDFVDLFISRINNAELSAAKLLAIKECQDVISVWLNYALPLILYLCAANAEITSKTATAPVIPTLPRNKRAIAPHQPTEWLCGERIGAAIRASAHREATESTGTGPTKRPHIRRAHWHTYRVGPERVSTILKWIHPLAINADNGSDMPVTIRKV